MSYKIPYGRQDINQEDIDAIVQVLQSDFLTQGPKIKEFEDKFSEFIGCKFSVAVSNATAGLHIAALALGLKKDERVITTPITFAASANCIRYCDGEVWFADIDPDTYLIDYNAVESLILSKPEGFFTGMVLVDFAGLPINTEKFRKLANKHRLWIIEDACHAPGGFFIDSTNTKQMCGNGNYADIGIFSFHPVKHIACGEGGMITTNDEKLFKSLLKLRTHGITKENMSQNDGGWYYEMQDLGYNYRLTDFQAALGINQLKKNHEGLLKRNEIAEVYKKAFEGKLKFQELPEDTYNAHHLFVIEVENRKEMYNFLHSNGILVQIHYIPVHTLPYYKKMDYSSADLTNSENYYTKCLSLPMYPSLKPEELQYVVDKVSEFIDKN